MEDIRKTVRHTLLEPITIEGRTITELNFRRLKGKDIRSIERLDNDVDKAAYAISQLSGNPPELFDEMDAADIEAVTLIIEGFMKRKAAKTG